MLMEICNLITPEIHEVEPQIWNDFQNVLARMYDSKKLLKGVVL